MTGNVFFPSGAGASPSTRAAVPSAYSIDAFSEFSCFAVSRTPSTSALTASAAAAMDQAFELRTTQEHDEELFRDLFAADGDWDTPVDLKLSQKKAVIQQQQQKTSKPHIWSTGGGSPFLTTAFGPFASQPATTAHRAEPPTLSAPVPRLNLAELMNARPGDSSTNVWGGALGQLPETAEEEDDDDDSEDRPESNAKSKAKSSASALKLKSCSKLKVNSISSNNSSAKLQQETLSFLERLDLKALLHTPRPDVLDFYPTSSNGSVAGSAGISAATPQSVNRVDDPRVENECDPRVENERDPGALLMNNSNSVKSKSKPLGKKDPTTTTSSTSSEIATRLSHMEFTYGTTKSKLRKTRKCTIDRLANPILGYTSTLQALSPDQRRKREMTAMDEEAERGWSNSVASPMGAKLKRKEPQTTNVSNLSHLSSSAQCYEAAATASASFSRRLQKPAARSRAAINNQRDDERDNSSSSFPVKRQPLDKNNGSSRFLNARKAALKKKIEEKQRERSNQSFANPNEPFTGSVITQEAGAGSTFLTQHGDEEDKLQSRVKRASQQQQQLFSHPALPPQISNTEASRQPRRPVSVRVAKSESSVRTPGSRKADNKKPSEEREPETKNGAASQKPKRPLTNRQQPAAAMPRKSSNGEAGKPSGRRPFARSNTGNAPASSVLPPVEPSVPKRKLPVGKSSASAMVLMGTASQLGNNSSTNSAAPRRGSSRPARNAQTPKKTPSNQSFSGNATPKNKPANERIRRPSKESSGAAAAATTTGDHSTAAKNSVMLPSIRPPKGRQLTAEATARRGNAVYRRAKARTDMRSPSSLHMNPGLVTSERPAQTASKPPSSSSSPSKFGDSFTTPSITCRSCRVKIQMDFIESHECNPDDLRAAASRKSIDDTSVLTAATRASNSFVESFLHTGSAAAADEKLKSNGHGDPVSVRHAEVTELRLSSPRDQSGGYSKQLSQSSLSPTGSASSGGSHSPTHLSQLGRSVSAYLPGATEAGGYAHLPTQSAPALLPQQREVQSLIQCRVRGVRVNKDRVAVYSIISNIFKKDPFASSSFIGSSLISALGTPPTTNKQEIIIERRYREFYAFALTVYSMFPSQELWQRLPPKTLCFLKNTRNDGFLLRRKNGLDDFIRCAIEMMDLGSNAQGTIGQWYLVRKFLNLPSTLVATPTKDRNLVKAMHELKKHARQTLGWTPIGRVEEHDAIYEKTCDGFQMVKRVRQCPFPARAVFDMIVKSNQGGALAGSTASVVTDSATLLESKEPASLSSSATNAVSAWNPLVDHQELLRREDGHTWAERTTFKGGWITRNIQMTNFKSWKVEDNGTIVVVMIPADDADCRENSSDCSRVDCIMGGWMITPTPNDETCTVTWLMQANFGECDPHLEFTGSQGLTSFVSRKVLLSWADEIMYMLSALETSYVPSYYRALGPLLSGGDFQKLKLERSDTSSTCVVDDPRVYILARDLEPCLCLLIHKSTNKNVLIFKANLRSKSDLDNQAPIKAEWLMFEKSGNPRQDVSALERSTTYGFSTKLIGPNVHHFRLELIRRDCVLRYDSQHGHALFTTINDKPNQFLKRIFINYAKSSLLSFPKIDDVTIVGDNELETLNMKAAK